MYFHALQLKKNYTDFLRLTSKAKLTNWEDKQPEAVVLVVNVKTFSLDYIPQARGHKEPIYFILYYCMFTNICESIETIKLI